MLVSLNFQKENIGTVSITIALGKVKVKSLKLKSKDVSKWFQLD